MARAAKMSLRYALCKGRMLELTIESKEVCTAGGKFRNLQAMIRRWLEQEGTGTARCKVLDVSRTSMTSNFNMH